MPIIRKVWLSRLVLIWIPRASAPLWASFPSQRKHFFNPASNRWGRISTVWPSRWCFRWQSSKFQFPPKLLVLVLSSKTHPSLNYPFDIIANNFKLHNRSNQTSSGYRLRCTIGLNKTSLRLYIRERFREPLSSRHFCLLSFFLYLLIANVRT